jgi:putative component of membrane protein insertase Oxa1/YidC/SpoIIIJ protein YidD
MALARTFALTSIKAYRKCISPHKGFHCAHNTLHRAGSCSDFGLKAFEQHSLGEAWQRLKGRLEECRAAHATLMSTQGEDREEEKRKRCKAGKYEYCFELGSCADLGSIGCDIAACW